MAPESSSTPAWTASDLAGNPHASQDKPERVKRMFAAIAPAYDLNNRLHSFGRDQAWRRRAVAMAEVRPGDAVLDVACGTGDLSELFADAMAAVEAQAGAQAGVPAAGPRPCPVTGVDFTPAMLDVAREKSARRPPDRRPTFRVGDAMDLAIPDASVDVLSIAFGIRNVADPARAFSEFHRVLKPGGRLVVLEFTQPPMGLVRFLNGLYCRHLMPWTAALIARDRGGAYRYLPRSVDPFLDHHGLADALRRAGFTVVRQQLMTLGVVAVTLATRPGTPS